ncbi:Protein peste [Araneus ventricosus]|uniref:Scavenger receptor class B member 1 n=1 Tax=Araneus ventricosus TaxID=182803 RepID=A0A4Y2VYK2_ARAVE|nr:Protein peste [Araneus ventricosus]
MAAKCMSRKAAKIALWVSVLYWLFRNVSTDISHNSYKNQLKSDITLTEGFAPDGSSLVYGKNATNDGLLTVFTGETGSTDDKTSSTGGTVRTRSLTFNYTEDVSHYGVVTKRFKPTRNVFANGTENPDNSCFDIKERPSGVSDIKNCQFGAPALISWPHFYMADPLYLKDINGLQPNEADHGSHLDADPITGISLDIQVRFQINLELSRVRGLVQFDDIPEGIFPVFWAGLEIQVTDDWAHFLKGQINNPKIIAYSVLGSLVLICLILIVVSLIVLRRTDDEEDDPLLDVKEEHKQNLSKKVIVPNYNSSGSYKEGTSGIKQRMASKEAEASNSGSINSSLPKGAYEEEDVTVIPIDPSTDKKL